MGKTADEAFRAAVDEQPTLSDELVQWLKTTTTLDASPTKTVCIETHISWVFLTERFAYKLKKPVRFDFLDFSTAESPRFTGRAVVALACDPRVLERSGQALACRDLAEQHGFRDVDGRLPPGPLHDRPGHTPGASR